MAPIRKRARTPQNRRAGREVSNNDESSCKNQATETEERREEEACDVETEIEINDHEVFDCSICFDPLFPPLTQCHNGHVACPKCISKLSNKCHVCSAPTGHSRILQFDKVLEATRISCPNKKRGCQARFPYYQKNEHKISCTYSPCFCPHKSCKFSSSASSLSKHFKFVHSHIHKFEQGVPFNLSFTSSSHFEIFADACDRVFVVSASRVGKRIDLSVVWLHEPTSDEQEFCFEFSGDWGKKGRKWKCEGAVLRTTLENGIDDHSGKHVWGFYPDDDDDIRVSICISDLGALFMF